MKQKEWMTLTDACRYLSAISDGGPLTATDLLQFAMDDEINLSIRTTKPTTDPIWLAELWLPVRELPKEDLKAHDELFEEASADQRRVMSVVIGTEIFLGIGALQEPLWPDIWDINGFEGGAEFFARLWDLFQQPTNDDSGRLIPEVTEQMDSQGQGRNSCHHIQLLSKAHGVIFSLPTDLIPEGSYLVIRREELQKLFNDDKQKNHQSLTTRASNTVYKMILGMAMEKYGYNPESRRNAATGGNHGSICADLEKAGLPVDPDTIRDHLKAAYEATPPEKRKPNSGNS